MYTSKLKIKTCLWQGGHRKSPSTITAEIMARHDKKTSAGRAKMLSRGDTADRLEEVLI